MNIAFIRGQYLNNFELQSYYPLLKNKSFQITGFTSKKPIHKVQIPVKQFPSPVDFPNFPYKLPLLNRVFIDAMILFGMEENLKGFDIAHTRETYFHFSKQAVRAKTRGYIKKVLVTCSETIPFNHETIPGRHKLKQCVIKNADHFHCLTEKAKKTLIEEGVNPERITVIPYGIDLKMFKPNLITKTQKELIVLFVGRLEEQKGIKELLEVWNEIRKHYKATLKIIGRGPLEKIVRQHGLTPEYIPYSQIPQTMAEADIFVLPSKPTRFWEEYFGMVLLEAMASGLPIITTDCGAIPEVAGNAAYLIPHSNSKELYKGLTSLIKKPDWRKRLSEAGLQRVRENFNSAIQAEKLYKLYTNLTE
ncbi:MAG: glycosyltransferase family 4 protein [Patescibacteria group bacterium]|jgi:glycosyltransferase involved in cell wall biosynthesis